MKYGHFDDSAREYVIENPKTPVKWINYLGSLRFGGFVDHTGGLLLCKGDPALNRITKYIPQLPSSQLKGHTLYLRLRTAEGFKTLSPLFVPTLEPLDKYECRVGLGYTRFVSEIAGVRAEVTLFVPTGSEVLVEDITITNVSAAPLTVDAIPLVEYTHFDALKQFTNADWVPQTMQSVAHDGGGGRKLLAQYAFMNRDTRQSFLTATIPVSSFETCRAKFLGDNEYGTFADPLSLKQPELSNYQALRGDNVGALLLPLGTLAPGASKRFRVLLTQQEGTRAESLSRAQTAFAAFEGDAQTDAALATMRRYWDDYLGKMQVKTPSAALDSMVNVHNPRQCFMTKNWSRDLSLYQLGFGGRGIGFRDSSQDVMGVLASMAPEAKELIEKLLSVQKADGSAMHQFYASTMVANEGDSREEPDRPKYYGDDHLWIVLAVCAYLKETGDLAFLQRTLPFYDKQLELAEREQGTVLEHLKRAVAFTKQDVGAHGLPLLGFADWNDTVNLKKGAESLFVANLYGKALLELIELCTELGDLEQVQRYKRDYEQMRARVNEHAWDGEWYVRYFDHDGSIIGTHKNAQGKIWTNGQSWPVISGFATPERAQKALESVQRHLNTKNGIKLSAPGYDGYDHTKGGVTTYPPGAKENGGIFLHSNPWVMIAETLVGNGDRAFQYYQQINPAAKNEVMEEYELEPYVYAQNILGDEHAQFGLGRNSWLSGTASWCYQAATKHILGVRPTYKGLEVDPCIPKAWDGFEVTRVLRGTTYKIKVKNPSHVSKGVKQLLVDGKPVAGHVIPFVNDGKVHEVEVLLGAPEATAHPHPAAVNASAPAAP
ncbi:MAG: carbohydrate binding protein [Polyangiaceae bacterium]|jgi:cellobiose phosphorylase|nr:carbohydrate binding protein [Polyangiaceae bacterium]